MRDLIKKSGNKTPGVHCHYEEGRIEIRGISMPEDAASFFFDVVAWVSDYYREPQEVTTVVVALEHINSSSSSMLYKLFFALNRLVQYNKSDVRCKWYYIRDDQEIPDVADQILTYMSQLNIELIPVDDIDDGFTCEKISQVA